MRIVLLRVGIDSGSGGCQGPLFADGSFEYLPIPDGYRPDTRTYENTIGRKGRPLADYLPRQLRQRWRNTSLHIDPEFDTFTYGDPTQGAKRGLKVLSKGDYLIFYCGLEGWDFHSPPALYLMGYFEVLTAGLAKDFSEPEIQALFAENAHVRNRGFYEREKQQLVLVKGTTSSRLLSRAVLISESGIDRSGKPLKVLSKEMRSVFGDFGGKVGIQRSSPRWIDPAYAAAAVEFLRNLS
jgi:hypothetical protein